MRVREKPLDKYVSLPPTDLSASPRRCSKTYFCSVQGPRRDSCRLLACPLPVWASERVLRRLALSSNHPPHRSGSLSRSPTRSGTTSSGYPRAYRSPRVSKTSFRQVFVKLECCRCSQHYLPRERSDRCVPLRSANKYLVINFN